MENHFIINRLSSNCTHPFLPALPEIYHCARHTFACLAVEYGMPIDVLAKILGHTNTNMTRHYAKFSETLIGREMMRIGQQLNSAE